MKTTFDTWLLELAAAQKGGASLGDEDLPPATRGLAWLLPIVLSGDYSTGTLVGTIRAAPDAPSALASVTISSPVYDSSTGKTIWNATLAAGTGAGSTGSLPADTDGDGIEAFPIAFYLTPSGGAQQLLFGGAFKLLGKV